MKQKRYYVNEEYPAETWNSILCLSADAARRILNDEEYTEWCKDSEELMRASAEKAKELSGNTYYPGCYGDALEDC